MSENEDEEAMRMEAANRRYIVQFAGAMAGYVVVLVGVLFLVRGAEGEWWRFVVAPLPMVPLVFALFAFVGWLWAIDELQRKIQFEALAFAFGGTALLTFGYGFMQTVGFPQISWFFVWPVMAALWVVGVSVTSMRYR